jgi:hypothetical protein
MDTVCTTAIHALPPFFSFHPPITIFLFVVDKLLWFGDAVYEHPSKILSQSSISKLCGFVEPVLPMSWLMM